MKIEGCNSNIVYMGIRQAEKNVCPAVLTLKGLSVLRDFDKSNIIITMTILNYMPIYSCKLTITQACLGPYIMIKYIRKIIFRQKFGFSL